MEREKWIFSWHLDKLKKKMFTIAFTRERSNPKEKSPAIKKKMFQENQHTKKMWVWYRWEGIKRKEMNEYQRK